MLHAYCIFSLYTILSYLIAIYDLDIILNNSSFDLNFFCKNIIFWAGKQFYTVKQINQNQNVLIIPKNSTQVRFENDQKTEAFSISNSENNPDINPFTCISVQDENSMKPVKEKSLKKNKSHIQRQAEPIPTSFEGNSLLMPNEQHIQYPQMPGLLAPGHFANLFPSEKYAIEHTNVSIEEKFTKTCEKPKKKSSTLRRSEKMAKRKENLPI